ncbi:hypothetical protein QQY24_30020 [Streptomyces sp. TG1A-8]|nr:hypothetical protein [Streptomyces sp. TG1A-8]MDO0929441.1 hypothetical protein [Streptomyces sp. TG1A-8]
MASETARMTGSGVRVPPDPSKWAVPVTRAGDPERRTAAPYVTECFRRTA